MFLRANNCNCIHSQSIVTNTISHKLQSNRMDITERWKLAEKEINKMINHFNSLNIDNMVFAVETAKVKLKEFIRYLDNEGEPVKAVFKEPISKYVAEIEKMSKGIDTTKKNQQYANKKQEIKEGAGKDKEKEGFEDSLSQAIVKEKPNVKWTDIAGLDKAKEALQEAVILPIKYPEIFVGQRKPWKGILLYGPPGTGKTYLAKACATEMEKGTFFSISSSDIMSKYVGESEKIIKSLFAMARKEKPSIIFIDEVDSMGGNRGDGENEASRRVKTQFLVQMDGIGADKTGILVLGATNLPWALDPAIRRRFERRIYISLPDESTRKGLIQKLCDTTPNNLDEEDLVDLGKVSNGFSGSDIATLVRDAAYEPLRIAQNANKFRKTKNQKGEDAWTPVPPSENLPGAQYSSTTMEKLTGRIVLPSLEYHHFLIAMTRCKPTVSGSDLHRYVEFTQNFGQEG